MVGIKVKNNNAKKILSFLIKEGGKNSKGLDGIAANGYIYYINENNIIRCTKNGFEEETCFLEDYNKTLIKTYELWK